MLRFSLGTHNMIPLSVLQSAVENLYFTKEDQRLMVGGGSWGCKGLEWAVRGGGRCFSWW
jgi:hypothetical protein